VGFSVPRTVAATNKNPGFQIWPAQPGDPVLGIVGAVDACGVSTARGGECTAVQVGSILQRVASSL
jgi:hypothetical protein